MDTSERLLALWNSHQDADVAALYTEDYFGIDLTDRSRVQGVAGVTGQLDRFTRALPDLAFEFTEPLKQPDRLLIYWTARGTHHGTLLNLPPTGRKVCVNGISLLELRGDKICYGVHLWDLAGMLRDVGLLPELDYRTPVETPTFKQVLKTFNQDESRLSS